MNPAEKLDRQTLVRLAVLSALAMLFSTLLYRYTLRAWFQQDDFAWLGLRTQVNQAHDLWHALFAPMAQGTIRPISERAFFMVFSSLFGLDALPYRLLVYFTQLVNIALLTAVAWRLTRSLVAAFVAPVLWIANIALAEPLTWTSAYNEILCSTCFLVSFYGLLRYTQTGNWRFNALQWVSFLVGFGVLEINVVYPAIALLYVALLARPYVKRMLWLIPPAVLFAIVHTAVRPKTSDQVYALHVDFSMFSTLGAYWNRALGVATAAESFPEREFYPVLVTILMTCAILVLVAWRAWRKDWLPLFGLGWFVIALGPFLPVRNHISDYYLTVPVIGLALLGGFAMTISLRHGWGWRVAAGLTLAAYLACSIPATRKLSKDIWARSAPVKKLVLGVEKAYERDPGKTILLEGVDQLLFWDGVYDHPFRLFGAYRVYITPETVQKIPAAPDQGNIANYTLPRNQVLAGLESGEIVVYGVEGGVVHDITRMFKAAALNNAVPGEIEIGQPLMESLLGASWYQSEGDFRWMPKTATVRMGMPAGGAGEVKIHAFCTPAQVQSAPLQVSIGIEGKTYGPAQVRDCSHPVNLSFPFSVRPGTKDTVIAIEVDRTIRVGVDRRDLGLAVQTIEVKSRL